MMCELYSEAAASHMYWRKHGFRPITDACPRARRNITSARCREANPIILAPILCCSQACDLKASQFEVFSCTAAPLSGTHNTRLIGDELGLQQIQPRLGHTVSERQNPTVGLLCTVLRFFPAT